MSLKHKACSFFGHRNAELTSDKLTELESVIERLITNENVSLFLFGSRSNFDKICHEVVTKLKDKYDIKRLAYPCKHESVILESEKEKFEKMFKSIVLRESNILCFDEEANHKARNMSGKASYIERNYAMIDDSDYCIFYYDETYIPKQKKVNSNKDILPTKVTSSGTSLAYKYATQSKKTIINIFN